MKKSLVLALVALASTSFGLDMGAVKKAAATTTTTAVEATKEVARTEVTQTTNAVLGTPAADTAKPAPVAAAPAADTAKPVVAAPKVDSSKTAKKDAKKSKKSDKKAAPAKADKKAAPAKAEAKPAAKK